MWTSGRRVGRALAAGALLWSSACGDAPAPSGSDDGGAPQAGVGGSSTGVTSGGGSVTSGTSSGGSAGVGAGGSTSVPGGPLIESLTSSEASFSPYQPVSFTAIVTDPDGAADLAGGVLTDGAGHEYGTFLKSGGGDVYVMVLEWSAFEAVTPVEFANGGMPFAFSARFSDHAGHQATASSNISLDCGGGGYCDGACVDTGTNPGHCGACGNACSLCADGACAACVPVPGFVLGGCDEICASQGKSCAESACGSNAGALYADATCTGAMSSAFAFCNTPIVSDDYAACCCVPNG